MDYKFSKPIKYGKSKKQQNAIKTIMKGKKNLATQDSIKRVNKVRRDTQQIISPKVSPTDRLHSTFGPRKVIK